MDFFFIKIRIFLNNDIQNIIYIVLFNKYKFLKKYIVAHALLKNLLLKLFYNIKAFFLQIKRIGEKIIHFTFNSKKKLDTTKKSILVLDFNIVQYNELLKELSSLDKQILLLNQRRPVIWNLQSLRIFKKNRCTILNLSELQNEMNSQIAELQSTFLQGLEELWNKNNLFEPIFSVDSVSLWHSIKNSFIMICNSRLKESISRIVLLDKLFATHNISVILEWAELGQEEKEVLNVAKKHNIPTVMLQHAMYPTSKYWDLVARFVLFFSHSLISDHQALWGESTKKHASSYGYSKNLVVTGSPRHDGFLEHKTARKTNGTIILATTQVSGITSEYSTTDMYVKFDDFVREVCRVSKLFPEKKLIIKPHPAPNFINNVIELIREIDPKISINHTVDVKSLIANCDLLITFNNSTIALDSIMLGVPTISLQIEKWAEENDIVKANAVLSISKISDIENGMRCMLYDEELRNKMKNNADNFLGMYLSNRGLASKKLSEFLDTF